MPKPTITSMYEIEYVLENESRLQIINLEDGKSYQTIRFPKGTKLCLYMSKLPIEEKK